MADQSYATPTDDQMAWRDASSEPGTLPLHLVAFLQCGVDPILGARRADGRPLVGAGVGCRIADKNIVRVFVPLSPNGDLLEAFRHGSAVAATFSRARDHRSIQLKATAADVLDPHPDDLCEIARQSAIATDEPQPDDLCEIARQSAIATDELVKLGYSRIQAASHHAYEPGDLKVVSFRPERVFTQTPGPGAGAELKR